MTVLSNTLGVLDIKVTKNMDPERLHLFGSLTKLMILDALLNSLNSLSILIEKPFVCLVVIKLNIVEINCNKSIGQKRPDKLIRVPNLIAEIPVSDRNLNIKIDISVLLNVAQQREPKSISTAPRDSLWILLLSVLNTTSLLFIIQN
jgi:hypothetical protein